MPSGRPHSIYIDDDLWDAAMGLAEKHSTSIARIINNGLRAYLGIDVPMQTVTTTKPNTAKINELANLPTDGPQDDEPFGSGDRQAESAVASDEATAVITRRVTSTKPEKYVEPPKSIDQERLERMNATKYGKRK